jgi:hypothetical protein
MRVRMLDAMEYQNAIIASLQQVTFSLIYFFFYSFRHLAMQTVKDLHGQMQAMSNEHTTFRNTVTARLDALEVCGQWC